MNKIIYFKIYVWVTNTILNYDWTWIDIDLWDRHVSIFRSTDADIMVDHYDNTDDENNLDGWWVVDMSDEWSIDNMLLKLEDKDIDILDKYIRDKTDYIYQLVYTYN